MSGFNTLIGPGELDTLSAADLAARGNRRRLKVFLSVFGVVLLAGLAYTFLRPAEYRAQARIAVRPAGVVAELPSSASNAATVTTAASGSGVNSLQAEAGVLTSRPLIELALASLRAQGIEPAEFGDSPVQGIQSALSAEVVADSNIVTLTLTGERPRQLAALLNALVDAYTRRMVDSYVSSASAESETLREELQQLNRRLDEKRKALEDFRQSADIVSGERDENQILARVKGLSASLNLVNEKVAKAEGRVRSLRESMAGGKPVARARDDPTLAGLESRASQLRESLREMERTHTPQFMDMDPTARGMRTRLVELEAQITEQRASAGRTSLAEAEEELATAREEQQTLQAQIARDRGAVHAFSRSFSTFKSMQEELTQIETSRSALSERLLRTEASERSRAPAVNLIEAATVPATPWRPDYVRDAWISVGAALGLAFAAMGLVELFNRPPARSNAPVIVPQPWIAIGQELPPALNGAATLRPLPKAAHAAALLPSAAEQPRELSQPELAALLHNLSADDVVWAGLLACGATVDEIRAISATDLDAEAAGVRLAGPCARTLRLPSGLYARLAGALARAPQDGDKPIGLTAADAELSRRLLCAAHDAGLDDPAGVTTQALRHACIAHLVRQGLRFSDLDRVVGALAADVLAAYAGLAPAGVRRSIDQVSPWMPALEDLSAPA